MRIFRTSAISILVIFMGILVWVTVVAHSRQSGSTRQDMSQAHVIRQQSVEE